MKLHEKLAPYDSRMVEADAYEAPENGEYLVYNYSEPFSYNSKSFEFCQFNRFTRIQSTNRLSFDNCVFLNGFVLRNDLKHVIFKNCVILGKTLFKEDEEVIASRLESGVLINNCQFNSNHILEPCMLQELTIINCELEAIVNVDRVGTIRIDGEKTHIKSFQANSRGYLEKLVFFSSFIDQLYLEGIEKCVVELVDVKSRELRVLHGAKDLTVRSGQIDTISFNRIHLRSQILIDSCEVETFDIDYIHGKGILKLTGVEIDRVSISELDHCQTTIEVSGAKKLSNLELTNISSRVILNDLTLNGLSVNNCDLGQWEFGYIDWSKSFRLYLTGESSKKTGASIELWELSRQFKDYFLETNNHIYADIFRKSELEYYYRLLLEKVKKRNFSMNQFIDFLILGTNKWFSGFGRNPLRALSFLFGFHLIWFSLLIAYEVIPYRFCGSFNGDCGLGLFLSLLNPVHKLPEASGKTIYSTIDFCMRVSSAYFIYYFLKASRKFANIS